VRISFLFVSIDARSALDFPGRAKSASFFTPADYLLPLSFSCSVRSTVLNQSHPSFAPGLYYYLDGLLGMFFSEGRQTFDFSLPKYCDRHFLIFFS